MTRTGRERERVRERGERRETNVGEANVGKREVSYPRTLSMSSLNCSGLIAISLSIVTRLIMLGEDQRQCTSRASRDLAYSEPDSNSEFAIEKVRKKT
jgi:hypothetical protein